VARGTLENLTDPVVDDTVGQGCEVLDPANKNPGHRIVQFQAIVEQLKS